LWLRKRSPVFKIRELTGDSFLQLPAHLPRNAAVTLQNASARKAELVLVRAALVVAPKKVNNIEG
jgi:hypothetical protein